LNRQTVYRPLNNGCNNLDPKLSKLTILLAGLKDTGKIFETAFIDFPGPGTNTCFGSIEFDAHSEKSGELVEILCDKLKVGFQVSSEFVPGGFAGFHPCFSVFKQFINQRCPDIA